MTKEEIKKRLHNGNFAEAFENLDFYNLVKLYLQSWKVIETMDEEEAVQVRPNFHNLLLDEAIPIYERYFLVRMTCFSEFSNKRLMLSDNNKLLNIAEIGTPYGAYTSDDDFYKIKYIGSARWKMVFNPESDECKQFFENFESNAEKWKQQHMIEKECMIWI